jgi:hypothetical protein
VAPVHCHHLYYYWPRATQQVVSHQLVIAKAQVQYVGNPFGVCGGQTASAQFLSEHFDLSRPVIVPPMLHSHFHHLTPTDPQHTMMAMGRTTMLQLLCPLQSQIGRPAGTLLLTAFTSRTTNSSLCHKHYVQNMYIRWCITWIFPHACTAGLFSLKHM